MKSSLLLCVILFATFGCSSQQKVYEFDEILPRVSSDQHAELIDRYSRNKKEYSGLYNAYQVTATILNSEVELANLYTLAKLMQWDAAKARSHREKAFQEMSSQSKVFISFFAPERDHDDLHKPKSIWKVYLNFNGSRYEGKVKKLTDKLVHLQTLYPYHNRFSTAYEVTFNVPMNSVQTGVSTLTLTSTLGTTVFEFPAAKN